MLNGRATRRRIFPGGNCLREVRGLPPLPQSARQGWGTPVSRWVRVGHPPTNTCNLTVKSNLRELGNDGRSFLPITGSNRCLHGPIRDPGTGLFPLLWGSDCIVEADTRSHFGFPPETGAWAGSNSASELYESSLAEMDTGRGRCSLATSNNWLIQADLIQGDSLSFCE